MHVAYETSGNIAVGDEEVVRFMHFINGFNQLFDGNQNETIRKMYAEIKQFLLQKKEGDIDTRDILTIKGLIRRGEARTACTYNRIPLDHVHFLDLPFYETGRIEKNPISETDVQIVQKLLQEVQPHQIYVAGDLADPHGTLKHQSQMESAPFLGNDERLFWQRSEDRNRGTASLYDKLGLACYEAMEAFVEYKPL